MLGSTLPVMLLLSSYKKLTLILVCHKLWFFLVVLLDLAAHSRRIALLIVHLAFFLGCPMSFPGLQVESPDFSLGRYLGPK